jgi:hypothetical protein
MMPRWKASLIAFVVAAAFLNAAIVNNPWIILASTGAAMFFGMRWLIRHHPYVAIALIGFCSRGDLNSNERKRL